MSSSPLPVAVIIRSVKHTVGTRVSGGTLVVNNSTGSGTGTGGAVRVTADPLGGTGAISGAVTIGTGGTRVH
ncbi:MAG TPA: hypothetical protein VNY07_06170 [Chthoniobacterales bacterium]|nr:hypothetical protein [Chthoniobacterales bacterium]